jgi:hypothetical protein
VDAVVSEVVICGGAVPFRRARRRQFLSGDLEDLAMANRRQDKARFEELTAMRAERFERWRDSPNCPRHGVLAQITMEAAGDPGFSRWKKGTSRALVGVEAVA